MIRLIYKKLQILTDDLKLKLMDTFNVEVDFLNFGSGIYNLKLKIDDKIIYVTINYSIFDNNNIKIISYNINIFKNSLLNASGNLIHDKAVIEYIKGFIK